MRSDEFFHHSIVPILGRKQDRCCPIRCQCKIDVATGGNQLLVFCYLLETLGDRVELVELVVLVEA